ncbi:hypothetical protein CQ052_13015 [Ochrobactrum sp. MYb15]|uniref:hypothetical protein n=1 Tax=Brucella TaxID=234 RepID=UPI000463D5A4|nr:hypothetical protein [Brucella rhizosphaerae]PQZ50192.1 hypothetical protein CQZ90_06140 [Ochrobactrum sp. MYb19]PRA55159.1 hypothetical protein CQ062_09680 [Ochrobactrum sp. MYb68]PRA68234.1 hypothetical protein CQ053_01130 [Ochrobactrum sp. MYb18]PRA74539.1 hypothetical protein CQ049_14950 [Brucella thiophenivorans]PRA90484.1 hypothetical protein CQ051_11035 [Ochrobactrum sp. MYb14]PRA95935.1 hypothetical protein CQ052_13015 [Ochrobactrum sp. MYb15]
MTIHIKNIEQQIAGMRQDWPLFRFRRGGRGSATWTGDVKPQFSKYRIEIRYVVGTMPQVRVLSPALIQIPDNEEGPLPHIYGPIEDPTLCLFDPANQEWNGSLLISQTIVPWSLDWLMYYEFWLMKKVWAGGGRHPGDTQEQIQP